MEVRARDIVNWAREAIDELAHAYGSKAAVFIALEELGVSRHWVQKFACGSRDNPTQSQLDKLVEALSQLLERSRAA